jgi:cytochrome P450
METAAQEEEKVEYDPIYDPFNPELIADPYPFYARMRDEHPVYYNERMDFYALSRYDDIFHALRKPQIFSTAHKGSRLSRTRSASSAFRRPSS